MKNTFKYILFTLTTLFSVMSYAQLRIKVPSSFVETKPPIAYSIPWHKLNSSKREYRVRDFEGALEIRRTPSMNWNLLSIQGGLLKAIDHGEFGGSLTFTPNDNTQQPIEIKEGNVKFVFSYKDKIYFIEGLAHMDHSGGALYELIRTGHDFSYKKLLDFEDAPEAFTIYNDQFLIAAHESFYIVKDLKKERLFKNAFWTGLYPNSIAAFDDENVFIGMRGGIVKLDFTEGTLVFYKND
ncbi:hypothetical protein CJD36_005230 [Flavipsychrobacter stenotrophus]|uniref:Uncharacterized protein n=1 Tax=Flavipsychrobacter stenotrophus TaxID=2077091 RepID=A0A2S7SWA4_9BACT|nr:hypothetical protein [Flavipsychrobacter stenotrophus]PQJ11210.1 hypothetical protein CJD36_005230 [Flavipsychrobacter stenotrophus]